MEQGKKKELSKAQQIESLLMEKQNILNYGAFKTKAAFVRRLRRLLLLEKRLGIVRMSKKHQVNGR